MYVYGVHARAVVLTFDLDVIVLSSGSVYIRMCESKLLVERVNKNGWKSIRRFLLGGHP